MKLPYLHTVADSQVQVEEPALEPLGEGDREEAGLDEDRVALVAEPDSIPGALEIGEDLLQVRVEVALAVSFDRDHRRAADHVLDDKPLAAFDVHAEQVYLAVVHLIESDGFDRDGVLIGWLVVVVHYRRGTLGADEAGGVTGVELDRAGFIADRFRDDGHVGAVEEVLFQLQDVLGVSFDKRGFDAVFNPAEHVRCLWSEDADFADVLGDEPFGGAGDVETVVQVMDSPNDSQQIKRIKRITRLRALSCRMSWQ